MSSCVRIMASGIVIATAVACGGGTAATNPPAAASSAPIATIAPAQTAPVSVPTSAAGSATATISGTISLKGTMAGAPVDATGPFTNTVQSSSEGRSACTDFTLLGDTGSDTQFEMDDSALIASHQIEISVAPAATYHGPGDYQYQDDDNRLPTGSLITIDVDQDNTDAFGGSGTSDLKVNSDGSGTVTFTGVQDSNGSEDKVDGSMTWTCSPA